MIRNFLFLLFALIVSVNVAQADAPRRAMFVTVMDAHPVLADREAISQLVKDAAEVRVNTLFVQVYRAGIAWFPSKIADNTPYRKSLRSVGEDPLAMLIRQAHAQGIKVHAWLNMMSLSQNKDAWIIKKYGREILTRNVIKKRVLEDYWIDSQFFLEPGDPRVREYLTGIVTEVLKAYPDLDGIQFDYIRYPDFEPHYGYTPVNVERFKTATGLSVIDDQSSIWQDWKRNQVTELVEELTKQSRLIHPNIKVSVTGCAPFIRAYAEAFQDWQLWVNTGLIDFVTLMSYPKDLETFKRYVNEAITKTSNLDHLHVAVPAYKLMNDSTEFMRQFGFCEFAGLGSCVIFHYGSFLDSPGMKNILKNL